MTDGTSLPARATRLRRELQMLYRVVGERRWHRGLTIDVSESGMLFQAAHPLALGTAVEMTFHLPVPVGCLPGGTVTCSGRVVRQALTRSSMIRYPVAVTLISVGFIG